jgi:hypothetical protein
LPDGLTFQVDLGDRLGCDVYYGYFDERFEASLFAEVLQSGATMLDVVSRLFYKPEYETNYQAAAKNAAVFARASQDEQALSSLMRDTGEVWRQLFGDLDQLRTGRLLAFPRSGVPTRWPAARS